MELDEYASLDATALRECLVQGDVAAPELADTARRALARVNDALNALTIPPLDPALDANPNGRLGSVPFLLKDSAPFARGLPFSLGSRSISGAAAAADHPLMRKFRDCGLAAVGQTTAPEWSLSFATESLRYGVTRNPWALERSVGGSSGGAAALVAAGAVPLAHASDGAGSIRIPASCCGVVGMKPSRGRTTPSNPALRLPGSSGPPTAGAALGVDFAVTRTVRDTALLLELVTEPGFPTPAPAGTSPLRVAVTTASWSGAAINSEVAAAVTAAAEMLEWIGHRVTASSPTLDADDIRDGAALGFLAAGQQILAAPVQPRRDLLETVSRSVLDATLALSRPQAEASLAAQARVTRAVQGFFAHTDILVTPTLAQLPPPHGTLDYNRPRDRGGPPLQQVQSWIDEMFEFGPFTAAFNIAGNPAISLPLGHSVHGVPIGVQLVAAWGRDELLLDVAADLERAMPWKNRLPPIFVS
ncbi:amidase [Glaciihabitans tibetensis]|uniref:amidase n=1 Tax=Glaciihabitans tibetensis TaxID=1266600 RepID=UPI000D052245|nr:amidase family protein [Glaciihabitans tibetensis]